MVSNRRTGSVQVHSITSVPAPLADDIARRARRYLFQMGLRTLCFIGAVATWGRVPTAVSVSLLVGAVILPYVAVVLANAGRERPARPDEFTARYQLGATPPPVDDVGAVHHIVVDPVGAPATTPSGGPRPPADRTGRDGADENGVLRG